MNLTREELLKIPKRRWDEVINNVRSVYVLPSGIRHDSGYYCMHFVAETWDDKLIRFGGKCDDVRLNGTNFKMDCMYPSGVIRIWNPRKRFSITHDLSSIEFVEEDY